MRHTPAPVLPFHAPTGKASGVSPCLNLKLGFGFGSGHNYMPMRPHLGGLKLRFGLGFGSESGQSYMHMGSHLEGLAALALLDVLDRGERHAAQALLKRVVCGEEVPAHVLKRPRHKQGSKDGSASRVDGGFEGGGQGGYGYK